MDKTPRQLAEERLEIAENYARLGEAKVAMMRLWAKFYTAHRPSHKSDASVQRAFDMTEDGLDLMIVREKMKSQEHRLSAIRTMLEVANNELKNQY